MDRVAQRVALSYPRRVSRLVMIAAQTPAHELEALSGLREEVRALEDPVPHEFVREFQKSTIYHPVPQEFLDTAISESLKLPARVWRDYLEQAVLSIDRDYVLELPEIKALTLVLWGKGWCASSSKTSNRAPGMSSATARQSGGRAVVSRPPASTSVGAAIDGRRSVVSW